MKKNIATTSNRPPPLLLLLILKYNRQLTDKRTSNVGSLVAY